MKLLEPQFLVILLVIVLIIFGPKQLPELGKVLGQTVKSIRDGVEDDTPEASQSARRAEDDSADE